MQITTEQYGDVIVVRLEDELTQENVSRFEAVLEHPQEDGTRNIVIDMEKTESLDNAGLEALDDLIRRLNACDGQLKMSGLGPTCRKIFELTRFDRRVDIFDSLLDAVRSFH